VIKSAKCWLKESIQNSINEVIKNFISKNNLSVDPETLGNNIQVSVKVEMTR